jgi:uncharacterized protein YjbJ (UPF0337 family)
VNEDVIMGAVMEAGGAIKEMPGHMSGDANLTARVALERAAGRLQYALANARKAVRKLH